jgi:hypothetical protein
LDPLIKRSGRSRSYVVTQAIKSFVPGPIGHAPSLLSLFARVIIIGADIDWVSTRRPGDVDRGRLDRTARANRRRSGLQPEIEDELRRIELDELAFGAAPLDKVIVAKGSWPGDAPIWLSVGKIGQYSASPVDREADIVVHRHLRIEIVKEQAICQVVANDHVA